MKNIDTIIKNNEEVKNLRRLIDLELFRLENSFKDKINM
jgi:hypothetical protein